MTIGYAHVSDRGQSDRGQGLALQLEALMAAGCDRTFSDTSSDTSSGTATGDGDERPGLAEALGHLRRGDTLVVWRLDRLGRSLKNLIEVTQGLDRKGVGLRSLQEGIDTAAPGGEAAPRVFGALADLERELAERELAERELAEFERDLVRERKSAGLAAARSEGRAGGRRPVLVGKKAEAALSLYNGKTLPVSEICTALGVGRSAFYLFLKERGVPRRAAG